MCQRFFLHPEAEWWVIGLMMEAESASETLVSFYKTTRRSIPENRNLHARRLENLISHLFSACLYVGEPVFICNFVAATYEFPLVYVRRFQVTEMTMEWWRRKIAMLIAIIVICKNWSSSPSSSPTIWLEGYAISEINSELVQAIWPNL
jgi:hypothetical protein